MKTSRTTNDRPPAKRKQLKQLSKVLDLWSKADESLRVAIRAAWPNTCSPMLVLFEGDDALLAFVNLMEEKLQENSHKTGWGDESLMFFMRRLREEVDELESALRRKRGSPKAVQREAADVANFAMMLSSRCDMHTLKEYRGTL